MLLSALTEGLPVTVVPPPATGGGGAPAAAVADPRICDITEDSRTVMPGSLFVARKGEKSDGNAFIAGAVAAGAAAILSDNPRASVPSSPGRAVVMTSRELPATVAAMGERFFGKPSSRLTMVGITGTKGKTTCAYLTRQLLSASGQRCGLIGTVCIDDGVEVAPAQLTTPPALELSRTIARMVDAGCAACVMETSSHALDQGRVAALAYKVGVFTNLGHDHLDYHRTVEEYAAAKTRLFAMLPDAGQGGVAVMNADDPWCERMLKGEGGCRARVVRCSMKSRRSGGDPAIDCSARIVSESPAGTVLDVVAPFTGDRPAQVFLPLIGAHNVMNALQAACVAHACGVDARLVVETLGFVAAPPGRMEPVTAPEAQFAVYVDYAHTPDSLAAVLSVARRAVDADRKGGRVIAVFGCGGDRDKTKRPKMGAAAAELADLAFVTSDNPRTEDPHAIIEQVVAGVPAQKRQGVRVEPDRANAIAAAVGEARAGDVLLIAGKGHEDYQILPDRTAAGGMRKIHFDDREQAISALRARSIATVDFTPGCLIPPIRQPQHHASTPAAPVRHAARPRPADSTGENR